MFSTLLKIRKPPCNSRTWRGEMRPMFLGDAHAGKVFQYQNTSELPRGFNFGSPPLLCAGFSVGWDNAFFLFPRRSAPRGWLEKMNRVFPRNSNRKRPKSTSPQKALYPTHRPMTILLFCSRTLICRTHPEGGEGSELIAPTETYLEGSKGAMAPGGTY